MLSEGHMALLLFSEYLVTVQYKEMGIVHIPFAQCFTEA